MVAAGTLCRRAARRALGAGGRLGGGEHAETRTENNRRITLSVAFNYGGRWDVVQACRKAIALGAQPAGADEAWVSRRMALAFAPDPDLFIRTGGEMRISNFVLWQAAYSELFFTE